MKKIVIFALKGPESNGVSGGIEVYEHELACFLESIGYKVEIYCGRDKGENELPDFEQISRHITVRRFNSPFNFLPLCMIPMHWYHITKGKRDTDYVIENQSVFLMGTTFYKNNILTIIHHLTGSDFIRKQGKVKGSIGYILEQYILPILYKKQNILTVSEHTKSEILKHGFTSEKVTVIPPIVRTSGSQYSYNTNRKNIISYIGRYTGKGGNKRIDDVIEVLPEVIKEIPDLKLVIAGSMKNGEELVDLVKLLKLEKYVEFRGFIDEKEKADILSSSKIFASPSYQEGFGITYIEAHSYGTPVVGYEIEGLDTVPSDSGIMVTKGNKKELSKAIITLLNNEEEWIKISKGAIKNAEKYSMYHIQSEMDNYINSLITREHDKNDGYFSSI